MKLTIFFDGGNRNSQKIASGAAVAYDDQGQEIRARAKFLDAGQSNNVAEYSGLLLALDIAQELGATHVDIYGDSELVVRQVDGRYNARHPELRQMRDLVWEMGRDFEYVRILETPRGKRNRRRDNNQRADELCGQCMDERRDLLVIPMPTPATA